MTTRIRWEHYQNGDIATLHSEERFWDSVHAFIHATELTSNQQRLTDDLLAIHGVVEATFKMHEIRITKGRVFTWEEIAPRVESVLSEWCGHEIVNVGPVRGNPQAD
ncbi:hypothetical protein [Kordiimonas sp.]|uniref:hypothetical protein n=1 Tax=Kordiimonas sp. TaxID=1970157 RepID=UPI003A8D7774